MFDFYSKGTEHVRSEAFLHSNEPTTWPDMVRQNRDTDFNMDLQTASSRGWLALFLAQVGELFRRWFMKPRRSSAELPKVQSQYLPVKRNTTVNR